MIPSQAIKSIIMYWVWVIEGHYVKFDLGWLFELLLAWTSLAILSWPLASTRHILTWRPQNCLSMNIFSFFRQFFINPKDGCAWKSQQIPLAPTTIPKSLKSPFFPIPISLLCLWLNAFINTELVFALMSKCKVAFGCITILFRMHYY